MEYICESSENEMIALFLQTEIRSERYRDEILQALSGFGARESVILEPDIGSDGENVLRRKVLARFRGYGEDREIFEGFPAVNIRNGVEIFGVSNDGFLAGAKALLDGAAFPPMILVSDNEETIVLEGHFRLTVYMLEPVCAKDKLKVMIGYTSKEKLMKWSLY